MNQVWILRAFIGDSTIALTYAYFLLESKLAESYTLALSIIKTAAPLFNPPNFMVDFESGEHRAIRNCYPNATIHGCLFHWKQAIVRHYSISCDFPKFERLKPGLKQEYAPVWGRA